MQPWGGDPEKLKRAPVWLHRESHNAFHLLRLRPHHHRRDVVLQREGQMVVQDVLAALLGADGEANGEGVGLQVLDGHWQMVRNPVENMGDVGSIGYLSKDPLPPPPLVEVNRGVPTPPPVYLARLVHFWKKKKENRKDGCTPIKVLFQ